MKMRLVCLSLATALALTTAAYAKDKAPAAPVQLNPTISIGVTESEEGSPDTATITAGVNNRASSAALAMDKNNRSMSQIIAVLDAAGIDAKDRTTSDVLVDQEYDYSSGRRPKDFVASSSVGVDAHNISSLGKLMADLVAAGATQLNGPYFSLKEDDVLTDKARERAFDAARRRALAYAKKAGFRDVRLTAISENAGGLGVPFPIDTRVGFLGNETAAGAAADAVMAAGAAAAEGAAAAVDAMAAASSRPVVPAKIEPGVISKSVSAIFQFELTK
jgi:uncharacterized protein